MLRSSFLLSLQQINVKQLYMGNYSMMKLYQYLNRSQWCIKSQSLFIQNYFYLMNSNQYPRQSADYYNRNTFGSNNLGDSVIDLTASDATDLEEERFSEVVYVKVEDKKSIESCIYPQIQEIQYVVHGERQTLQERHERKQQQNKEKTKSLQKLQDSAQKDKEQQMPLMVLIILTSEKEISQIEVISKQDPTKPIKIYYDMAQKYEKTNVLIFFFKTKLQELINLKIKYREKPINFAWMRSKMNVQLEFEGAMMQEQAVLHFHELTQRNTNIGLQNYCLLIAQDILATKYKCLNNKKTIAKFHKIFKDIFKPQVEINKSIFKYYKFKDMNMHQTQYFLYFFYTIYRDKQPLQKLKEFQILSKFSQLDLSKQFKKALQYKNFEIFQASYQLFLMQTFFLIAMYQKKDDEILRQIVIWNILNQDDMTVKETLIKLQPFKHSFRIIFDQYQVRNVILRNPQINFQCYTLYILRIVEEKLWKAGQEQVNFLLIKFIDSLVVKQRLCVQRHQNVKLNNFEGKIECLFVKDNKLKMQIRVGELYNKIKMCMNHSNYIGHYFMNILKKYFMEALPGALVQDYQTTIIPLVMKPVIEQESSILLQYFQKNQIKIDQLMLLVKILQQMKDDQYNISVIEMMIIQFFALNQYFNQDFLELMIKQFSNEFLNIKATQRYRKSFPVFCEKIIHSMKQESMRKYLSQWLESFKPNFI